MSTFVLERRQQGVLGLGRMSQVSVVKDKLCINDPYQITINQY
jgi:hypothetical protein